MLRSSSPRRSPTSSRARCSPSTAAPRPDAPFSPSAPPNPSPIYLGDGAARRRLWLQRVHGVHQRGAVAVVGDAVVAEAAGVARDRLVDLDALPAEDRGIAPSGGPMDSRTRISVLSNP